MAESKKTRPDGQPERRRAGRRALSLNATMREGSRSKVAVRVIDISTHGCRVQCTTAVADDALVWLNIEGLETQYCRVVWHCHEFVGLEFEKPLADAVFERLLKGEEQLSETTIAELRGIATRTHWLATQADVAHIHTLAEISRQCAVDAIVEGFRLGKESGAAPKAPDA
jgi:hypothetical protein